MPIHTITPDPRLVCRVIRQLLKIQCRDSTMNAAAVRFITDNELVRESNWPAYHLTVTDEGHEFLRKHEEESL